MAPAAVVGNFVTQNSGRDAFVNALLVALAQPKLRAHMIVVDKVRKKWAYIYAYL